MDEPIEEDDTWSTIIFHGIGIVLFAIFCRKCCRRKPLSSPALQEVKVELEQIQPRKSVLTSYVLLFTGGIFGVHHYYLDRVSHGLCATWTLNFFGLGFVLDLLLVGHYVRNFNDRCCPPSDGVLPVDDQSSRKVLLKFPVLLIVFVGLIVGVVGYGPSTLQRIGLVDMDRLAAQTEANPYDILELDGNADLSQAKAAYRKQSLKWHPDRNPGCGKECEDKMSEITKAFDLIKKKQSPPPPDRSWSGRLKAIGMDWFRLLEALLSEEASQPPPSPSRKADKSDL